VRGFGDKKEKLSKAGFGADGLSPCHLRGWGAGKLFLGKEDVAPEEGGSRRAVLPGACASEGATGEGGACGEGMGAEGNGTRNGWTGGTGRVLPNRSFIVAAVGSCYARRDSGGDAVFSRSCLT